MSIHAPDPTDPVIKLEDAVDQNGRARYEADCSGMVNEDATIAPWLDVPVSSYSELLFSGADLCFLNITAHTAPEISISRETFWDTIFRIFTKGIACFVYFDAGQLSQPFARFEAIRSVAEHFDYFGLQETLNR